MRYVIALARAHLIDQEGRQPRLTQGEMERAVTALGRLGHTGLVRIVQLREGQRARLWGEVEL